MKPEFVLLVFIMILLGWAVMQSTFDDISIIERSTKNITSNGSSNSSNSGSNSYQSGVELYGRIESPFSEQITLHKASAKNDDEKREYLEVRADDDNTSWISITGWKLKSLIDSTEISIGNAATIPIYPGNNIESSPIRLEPSDRAYIVTGSSPIRVSFRTNICTGYFQQKNTFHPRLPEQCPNPEDENLEKFGINSNAPKNHSDTQCIKEIKRVSRCQDPGKPDEDLNNDCKDYIRDIGYMQCALLHVTDPNFAGNEWYLYIDKSSDIWEDDGDTILLLDNIGRVVDSISY